MYKVLLLFLLHSFLLSQVQIGNDIDANAATDFFGFSSAISSDGSIVAIGAPFNDGNLENAGSVRIFQNQGGNWVQIGEEIYGDNVDDNLGRSVALSSDGLIMATGADENDANGNNAGQVKVFENQGGSWIQIGEDILGDASSDLFGKQIALSNDGTILAISAPANDSNGNSSGHVKVFENEGGSWVQLGDVIEGESTFATSGSGLAISADGKLVAIGSPLRAGGSGSIRAMILQGDSWVQLGQSIEGAGNDDQFGAAVSLSEDGRIMAAISKGTAGSAFENGYVRVFEYDGNDWLQIGDAIEGEAIGDGSNPSSSKNIDLSANGKIIAIGTRNNAGNGEKAGNARQFQLLENEWILLGEDIDGEAAGDLFGQSVALSADGKTLLATARENEGAGPDAGHARVFDYESLITSLNDFNQFTFSIYPNPVSEKLNIELSSEQTFLSASLYNMFGQIVKVTSDLVIETSDLPNGNYFIKVETTKGASIQKIVIL